MGGPQTLSSSYGGSTFSSGGIASCVQSVAPTSAFAKSFYEANDPYGLYGKQFVHSKSSQYKKLKAEWRSNVFLARSKIQVREMEDGRGSFVASWQL